MATTALNIQVDTGTVSALVDEPSHPRAACVLAHGAGAGMAHPFMARTAAALVQHGIAVLRYQFPYMERSSRRPDVPAVAHAAVRAAVAEAVRRWPGLPVVAGGKSFGGRMTSQAQAAEPLPGVAGLVFLGFPLHPAGKPAIERAQHLATVCVPMLFVQGTRDEMADAGLMGPVVQRLGSHAMLHWVDGGDHSLQLPRSRQAPLQSLDEACEVIAQWIAQLKR